MEGTRKKRTIVVTELRKGTKMFDLYKQFEHFGEMNSIKVEERGRGESVTNIGVIRFVSGDSAEKAVEKKEIELDGQLAKIGYAKSTQRRPATSLSRTRLHVSGIGKLGEEELSKMLGNCSLIFPKKADPNNQYVFAQYENEEEKQQAIDKLNGKKIDDENVLKLSPAYVQRPRMPRRGPPAE